MHVRTSFLQRNRRSNYGIARWQPEQTGASTCFWASDILPVCGGEQSAPMCLLLLAPSCLFVKLLTGRLHSPPLLLFEHLRLCMPSAVFFWHCHYPRRFPARLLCSQLFLCCLCNTSSHLSICTAFRFLRNPLLNTLALPGYCVGRFASFLRSTTRSLILSNELPSTAVTPYQDTKHIKMYACANI